MKRIIIVIVLLTVAFLSFANDFFLKATGPVHYTEPSGSAALLTYSFMVENNTGSPLYLNSQSILGKLDLTIDRTQTTCTFSPVAAHGSCALVYQSRVPTLATGVAKQTYLDTISVKSRMGYTVYYRGVGVTVDRRVVKGHFNLSATTLALKAGDTGSVTVKNTGNKPITAKGTSIVKLPGQLETGEFNTDCGKTLAVNDSCRIEYTIVSHPTAGTTPIPFNGNADNNTLTLPVTISTIGHFDLSKASLTLKAGDTRSVTVRNTGNKPITATGTSVVAIPSQLQSDGVSTDCGKTLAVNGSCYINYKIVAHPTVVNTSIPFDGDADNNTLTLPVTISTIGHFDLSDEELTLKPGDMGSVMVRNTGNKPITATGTSVVAIPPQLHSEGFSTDCGKTLAVNSTCHIEYMIDDYPAVGITPITFDGDADNNTLTLPVTISTIGHFELTDEILALKAGDSGTVIVTNTGNHIITAVGPSIIGLPEQLVIDGFSTDCGKTLVVSDSCHIDYTIDDYPTAGSMPITFDGDADNNTLILPVTISTIGHFDLSEDILALKAGDTGSVTVRNTGNKIITATGARVVSIPAQLQSDGVNTDCGKTLAIDASCNIHYKIIARPTMATPSITFDGDADNNTITLPVTISANIGHFELAKEKLVLKAGDSGIVIVTNTGNRTITATGSSIIELPEQLVIDGFSTDCGRTLTAGFSCNIMYLIVMNPKLMVSSITFNGDADNNTITLPVTMRNKL